MAFINKDSRLHLLGLGQESLDEGLQLPGVGCELPDAVREFVGRHFILVHIPTELGLRESDLLEVALGGHFGVQDLY